MKETIDYISLMDVAKTNLINKINDTVELYKKEKTPQVKKQLMDLMYDRKNLFLFNKETIKKYL